MCSSVYIHIPFCQDICSYCDFCRFYYDTNLVDKYLDILSKEIDDNYNGEVINTIYIGGGTPSSLSISQIEKLLDITKKFNTELLEFTFECNIESIDENKIKILKKYGVNRISIGVQTFNSDFLSILNRHHNPKEVLNIINMIKKYISNINVDLIYAIPGEDINDVKKDIDEFLKLDIPHISTYSLIIEDNTILKNLKVKYIDEDLDYEMYKLINNKLKGKGYIHYETSNYCKEGYESKHNLVYWNNEYYYGFGMGSSGYVKGIRYTNTRSINNYMGCMYKLKEEALSFNEIIENEFILGFRKIKGIYINKLNSKYKLDINKIDFINKLIKDKKLVLEDNYLRINDKYIYISNDILIEFMGVDYEKYI